MRIFLVRHGETNWNLNNLLQGKSEIELNDTGKKQASNVKEKLINIKFDACFSSPLKRAIQTSKIITDGDIIIDERLIERDLGLLEGKNRESYDAKLYWDYKLNSSFNEVECIQHLLARTEDFIKYLKEEYNDKTILIVSHGATIRALHFVIKGYNENTDFLTLNVPNCCVFEYYL